MKKEEFSILFIKAIRIALQAHGGQVDKAGEPYILHPLSVFSKCETEKGKIVAILHDVVEDSPITLADIQKEIPDQEIIDAVDLLTKKEADKKRQGYKCYLCRIKSNEIAREVKIADLKHNMDLSRLKVVTERDIKRQKKYQKSLDFLQCKSCDFDF